MNDEYDILRNVTHYLSTVLHCLGTSVQQEFREYWAQCNYIASLRRHYTFGPAYVSKVRLRFHEGERVG